ncbi:uncharacterized protein LOC111708343 [Eurytemora carolleeae]|uniref:uncharacterized protein LOC111708343 n=1 Tax=Eurytemora carolleeae TaxID=1294199 RepID=UPI000C788E06|nr:uncharacterized protein LOC111708343 [Eurytemora carolleeae]|eukprot:XP_023337446.1 uncharacterized protein LOC111708343 [Eurytemora affinis]
MAKYCLLSGLLLLTLLSDRISADDNVEGGNATTTSTRGGKAIFNVVRFPNDACIGSNKFNGTCYTASECSSKSGTAAGACASGFGVCCTFSIACGATSSENNTYAVISSYSTSVDANPCIYTFCRQNANICKLRIDFESMTTSLPQGYEATDDVRTALANSYRLGQCVNDVVKITNPGGPSPPTICGVNTGQHMWVPASSACNQINIDVDTGKTTPRSWTISVKQFECGSTSMPQDDCLQYHTGTSGQFYSFAWDKSVTTLTTTSHTHLASQYYDICFRRERGYCSLCFTPHITSATAATYTSFGVSASGTAASSQSALSSLCGMSAAATTAEGNQDYIEVINLQATIGTTNTAGANKICGQKFSGAAAATVPATACTWSSPFRWGVRFSDSEGLAITATAMAANNVHENEGVGGNGYMGFYMDWWQNKC